jgi:hypothetical protein
MAGSWRYGVIEKVARFFIFHVAATGVAHFSFHSRSLTRPKNYLNKTRCKVVMAWKKRTGGIFRKTFISILCIALEKADGKGNMQNFCLFCFIQQKFSFII